MLTFGKIIFESLPNGIQQKIHMKIAIIELGNSHDECIYSQIKMIKSVEGTELTLICNSALTENVSHFDLVDKKLFVSIRNGMKQWADLYRLWRLLKVEKFDKIIFNTAQGKSIARLFRFPFGKKTQLYGVLHDIKKLTSSHSQRFISKKMGHYFLLNDYLMQSVQQTKSNRLSFSVFYPIFFPDFRSSLIEKKDDEIWVAVPGQVELKRRDYQTLFESIEKYGIKANIKFLLLGRCGHAHGDGDYVKQQIASLEVQNHFYLWDDFIPVENFHAWLRASDYILPLIHKGDVSGNLYTNQISGAFNLAAAYKKTMLIEQRFAANFDSFELQSYNKLDIMSCVNALEKKDSLEKYQQEKWLFEYQRDAYVKALELN